MSLKKDFILGPEWNAQMATALEMYLQRLNRDFPNVLTGTYIANGLAKEILVPDMDAPPLMLVIQSPAGVSTLLLAPGAALPVTSWNQFGFTVKAGAADVNTAGSTYRYLVIS
jgi:hypothetical protein